MPRVSISLLAVSALAALSNPASAQAPPGWAAFTRTFDEYAVHDSVVGASVLVLRDGDIVARHEYGFADRAAKVPVDERTIFHWASITKTLTAIAIFQLRDRGRLSLDDPVTHWVPELRQVHDSFGSMDVITIRMLLGHSAGFQDPTWPYTRGKSWEPFEPTRWDQLVAMMPYQEIHFAPDSRYGYSNPGFIYLARIIEAITGDPWEGYIYKSLWGPLGFTHSYFGNTPAWLAAARSNNYTLVADSATGEPAIRDNGRDFDPGVTIPNGGWNGPLSDLATYVAFLTGATPDRAVLSRASLEEMWRARLPTSQDSAEADSIGLSFFVLHRAGLRFVGHTGSQAGFRSFFYIDPQTRRGVIAAFNTSNEVHPDSSAAGFRAVRDAALTLLATDTVRHAGRTAP
jgi:CubicO group peptidase (beta-lactamase class C family)